MSNPVEQQTQEPLTNLADMSTKNAINYLATLPTLEYEQVRDEAAKVLNVRVGVLDGEIRKAIKAEHDNSQSDSDLFAAVEASLDPVNGEALLNRIENSCQQYVICEPHTRIAASLWITLTWLTEHVDCLPIANITAPEKNCGKSTLLGFIGGLAYKPLTTSSITSSALFRTIEKWHPTLLIDEADLFADEDEALRGIINAGHTKDSAFVIRCVGENHDPQRFSVWGAKALCGIGKRAGTIESRSIDLPLRRKLPDEKTKRLKKGKAEFASIQSQLARWSQDIGEQLSTFNPELPQELQNRDADNWEPLLAIADLAGGDWPKKARTAALMNINNEASLSINQELLNDIKDILEGVHTDHIFSYVLLEKLNGIEDAPWASYNRGKGLSPRQLASKLKGFGVYSGDRRIGIDTKKGYRIKDFKDAFSRYIPNTPILSATTLQASADAGCSQIQNATQDNYVADKKPTEPSSHAACSVVADKNGGVSPHKPWSEAI